MTARDCCPPLWIASRGAVHTCRALWWRRLGITAAPRLGDIGPVRRRVDLEPMPETTPIAEPAPAPAPLPAPDREPVPA